MRVLITGSRGFLAAHLARYVRRRFPTAVCFLLDHRHGPGVTVCELADPQETTVVLRRLRPTHIIHLAGTSRQGPWEQVWSAHVDATLGLMQAVRSIPELAKTHIVIAGSSAVYGRPLRPGPVVETDALNPVSPYGTSKKAQELIAMSYRHLNVRVIVARLFNIMGPGMPESLALGSFAGQIARIEHGEEPLRLRVGNLEPKRDYVDVRDVAEALMALAIRGIPGQAYNVCSGKSNSIGLLLEKMLALSQKRIRVASESSRKRIGDLLDLVGSHRKLTALTGWTPRIPLDQSIRDTLQWHRENLRSSF